MLTPKQAAFVHEYLLDLNGKQAAVRAGYSPRTADRTAYELLRKPAIKKAVDEAVERRSARVEVKADDVLRELLRLAATDIGEAFDELGRAKKLKDMPVDVRRAISGVKVTQLFEGHGEDRYHSGDLVELKFWDKTRALELLGKHLRLFADRVEHTGTLTLEQLVLGAAPKAGEK